MAFTVIFPTTGPSPDPGAVAAWLTARGEPFEQVGEGEWVLRALPLRLRIHSDRLQGQLDVTPVVPLDRVVDLVFDLSVFIGADVRLSGLGSVNRPGLWLYLADDQDRQRIAESLLRADEHGNRDEVVSRLWRIVDAIRPGHDDRWDAQRERVVELCEVGPDGLSVDEASWLVDDPKVGDVVPRPVTGSVHVITWRWLSEAYPGIAEGERTLH